MKRLFLSLLFTLSIVSAFSQFFPGTDSLRKYNQKYITNNPGTAFINHRLNTLLAGIINWVDSARLGEGGVPGVDTISIMNDSTIRYRSNGVWRNLILRGVYDNRRKVDTIYWFNDTILAQRINGTERLALMPAKPADLVYFTENDECVDTSFVGTSGLTYIKYEMKLLPQFVHYNIRVYGGFDTHQLAWTDIGIGVFGLWNKFTGVLKIFYSSFDPPCGDQRRYIQPY